MQRGLLDLLRYNYTTSDGAIVKQNILARTLYSILFECHRDFLIHWWDKNQLAAHMQMLYGAGIEPFAQMQEDLISTKALGSSWSQ